MHAFAMLSASSIAALTLAHAAQAVEFCVGSQTDLQTAASTATFAPTTIKLVQGTYQVAGTIFDFNNVACSGGDCASFANGLTLLGGYTANCASRNIDPSNTTLVPGSATAGFKITARGDVTIEGIGFADAGLAVQWNHYAADVQDDVHAAIRRNRVTGSSGLYLGWFPGSNQSLDARVVENLAYGIPDDGGICAFDLIADPGADATFYAINNTVVDNPGNGDAFCMGYPGADAQGGVGGSLLAYNNIIYGNGNIDLLTSTGSNTSLIDNVIGTHRYDGFVGIEIGTQTASPNLDAQFHPIESPPSEVINSGTNTVPGGLPAHDLDGGPRVVGSTVDRGAYESSIDDAFLQTVTNNNDTGAGSLRQAIVDVNANGNGLIDFAIGSSCGPHIITLASNLPALTTGTIINGYTQTGATQNDLTTGDDATICVILEAANSAVDTGLQVTSGAADATAIAIEGLGFSGFSGAAIDLQGGSKHFVGGNHFGGNIGGHVMQPNGIDIRLGSAAHDATIGGDDPANLNIIGDATGSGIVLQGGKSGALLLGTYNDQIIGNYIGVGWNPNTSAYTNRANGAEGIHLLGHDNTISGNLLGYNSQDAIMLDAGGAAQNLIEDNLIGTDNGGSNVGNFRGIQFTGSSGDAPANNTVRNNTISDNTKAGIWVQIGQGNKLRKNSISLNGALGIDLAAGGVTANDDDGAIQTADYANRGLNFPVLTSAAGGYHSGYAAGMLTTTSGDYTIDLYRSAACDASGNGEGQSWLGHATVTVPAPMFGDQGTASFEIRVTEAAPGSIFNGDSITATATDASGNTSEFSACQAYLNDTIFADGFEPSAF